VASLEDVRSVILAGVNALGMVATIVGVPLLVARRLARGRRGMVLPTAVAIGAGLTVATRRTGWSLVKLWLGIDDSSRSPRRTA
jgi:hypothetical protein